MEEKHLFLKAPLPLIDSRQKRDDKKHEERDEKWLHFHHLKHPIQPNKRVLLGNKFSETQFFSIQTICLTKWNDFSVVFQACNRRRKRSLAPFGEESRESATVSVGPLYTAGEGKTYFKYSPLTSLLLFEHNTAEVSYDDNLTVYSPPTEERPYAAAYSEYILITFINLHMYPNNLECVCTHQRLTFINLLLCASGNNLASKKDNVNVPGLVVGLVFALAAAILLVLGGWFVLKKYYWVGGLPHTFDWQIDCNHVFNVSLKRTVCLLWLYNIWQWNNLKKNKFISWQRKTI